MGLKKFTRVAVEGDTTDGRQIERKHIEQMGKNYNPLKYGARIWLEHLRGMLPDSVFRALGDVTAVKTEEIEIDGTKKLALFASLAPTPDLVAMNAARQKIYTSIEIDPNFANTGEAYLVGLAVTDSPASLGTEMLAFCANAGDKNPLNAKKQKPENMFSAAREAVLELDDSSDDVTLEDGKSFFKRIMDKLKGDKKEFSGSLDGVKEAIEAIAETQRDLMDQFSALTKGDGDTKLFRTELDALAVKLKKSDDDFTAFRKEIEEKPAPGNKPRPTFTGGDVQLTDC